MEVRPLRSEEWQGFRDLRLRALADAPDAFRTTHAEASLRTDAEWVEAVRSTAEDPDAVSWIAESDGVAVGQAFSQRLDESTLGIFGMWVAPDGRGMGVGRALLEAAEAWGRGLGYAIAHLWVAEGNAPAERLYRKAGYQPTGDGEALREGSDLYCQQLAKQL